jgi:hypothetical protein
MIASFQAPLVLAQAATTETSLTLTAIVAAAITAFLTSYFTDLGKRDSRKQHLEAILEETKRTQDLITRLELDLSQRQLIGETELQYRERQLAEFYGPIFGSIKSAGQLWRLWLDGKLKDFSHDVQELFRDQNDFIVDLLRANSHLVEGHIIPQCFARFITSVTIFNIGTRIGGDILNRRSLTYQRRVFQRTSSPPLLSRRRFSKRTLTDFTKLTRSLSLKSLSTKWLIGAWNGSSRAEVTLAAGPSRTCWSAS